MNCWVDVGYWSNSDAFKLSGRPVYRFEDSNLGTQETLFKFSFFSCISTKIMLKLSSDQSFHNAFFRKAQMAEMQSEEKNNETKRCQSERRNCLQKCFHSFRFLIDYINVGFFFWVKRLHCCIWFHPYYLMHLFISDPFAPLTSL